MSYPLHRGRRLRRTEALRALARETRLAADQLVAPFFVHEGARQAIGGLPGHARLAPEQAAEEAAVSGGFMGAAINIGEVYTHFVRDPHAGTYSTPGFEHALHNARPDLIRLN